MKGRRTSKAFRSNAVSFLALWILGSCAPPYDAVAAGHLNDFASRIESFCRPHCGPNFQPCLALHPECKEFPQLLAEINEFISVYPEYANVMLLRGNLFMFHGMAEEALRDYSECIAICQSGPNRYLLIHESDSPYSLSYYYIVRGATLEALGRYDEALADYLKAFELEDDCFDICDRIAALLSELGRSEESAAWLARADKDARRDKRPLLLKEAVDARQRGKDQGNGE